MSEDCGAVHMLNLLQSRRSAFGKLDIECLLGCDACCVWKGPTNSWSCHFGDLWDSSASLYAWQVCRSFAINFVRRWRWGLHAEVFAKRTTCEFSVCLSSTCLMVNSQVVGLLTMLLLSRSRNGHRLLARAIHCKYDCDP